MSNETPDQSASEQPASPAPKSPEERALEAHEVPEVMDFLRENGISVLVGIGLAVAVFLGWSAYTNYKKSAESTASDSLFRAQSVEQIQQVINQYSSTRAAPMAYLSLASAQFDAGQYDLANHTFAEFQQKYPDHAFALQAELGQALCKEASGQLNEALGAFELFASAHTNHYLVPLAVFGKARTLEQLGRFPEAKAVYEDFIAASPTNSPWSSRAEAAVLYVDKETRAAKLPKPPAPEPAPMLAPMTLSPAPTAVLPSPAPGPSAP
jgi:predicted negative regulator of RcsB-dependent stress response